MESRNGSVRVLLAVMMIVVLAFSSAGDMQPAAAEATIITLTIGNPNIAVNGTPHPIDASGSTPVIVAGRTLLPIRAVVEAIGGTIEWDATTRTVTITAGAVTMSLVIGNRTATVNGTRLPIDPQNASVVPLIVSGRTMLPVRFVGEQLGGTVAWDQATRTATLTFVAPSPLTAPTLLEPADGALFTSTTIAFRWTPVDGAASYDLSVSKAGSEVYRGTSTTTSLITSGTALSAGQYSWTVSAIRGSTEGPASLASKFAVRLSLSPSEIVLKATPAVAGITVTYADGTRAAAGGFCIDSTGIFVTTYEILKGGLSGSITLTDGSQRSDLRVLGYDPAADVAVIRAPGDNPVAALTLAGGPSAQLNQDVVMVGPIIAGIPQYVVTGVVNGTGPGTFTVKGASQNAVEGCPVLDSFGDVLGMVTTKIDPTAGSFPSVFAGVVQSLGKTDSWTIREVTEREGTGLQALDKPSLAEPANEAVVGNLTPGLRWNAVAGATRYQITVIEGRDTSGTAVVDDIITYVNPVINPGVLKTGVSYTWGVRAGNGHGWGPWSATRVFTTSATIVQPPTPTILEPLDKTVVKSVEPVLFWSALTGSNKYYVWVGTADGDTVFTGSSATTSLTVPAGKLQSGSTYLWSVRVENSSGVSSLWSANASLAMAVPATVGVPSVLTPAPKAIIPYLNPTFTWQSVPGATRYDVWIDKGTSDTKAYEATVTDTSCTVPAGVLEPGITYSFSVIAGTPDAWSKTGDTWNWSIDRAFTINLTAVIDIVSPRLLSPVEGTVLASLTPTLQWTTVQGAMWYRVYIGKGTNESDLEQILSLIVYTKPGDTQQYIIPSGTLDSGATYFWRVLAGAGDDVASPSLSRFKTP
ncbi:MAG: stalk domain-containing protein [Candidatus Cryosericum sp.]